MISLQDCLKWTALINTQSLLHFRSCQMWEHFSWKIPDFKINGRKWKYFYKIKNKLKYKNFQLVAKVRSPLRDIVVGKIRGEWKKIQGGRKKYFSNVLRSLAKLLRSLEKLCVLSQNFCVLSQNFCVPSRNFAFSRKTFAFPRETLRSLAKLLRSLAKIFAFPRKT